LQVLAGYIRNICKPVMLDGRHASQELPFPADYRKKPRNTLDYPPEGSPEAGE
jgi:hypothetical protein